MNGPRQPFIPLVLVFGCGWLAACGSSPPTRFFTLNAMAGATSPASPARELPVAVRLEPVVIPPELDRLEIVSRFGPNSVRIAGTERWAAPLDEQIRRVVSEDLAMRLPPRGVADPQEPATSEPRRLLSLEIDRFDVDERCAVALRAHWTLRHFPALDSKATAPGERGNEEVNSPGDGPCEAGEAAVMSRALATLTDRLAVMLATSGRHPVDSGPGAR